MKTEIVVEEAPREVWIATQWKDEAGEFQGVFSSEARAIAACATDHFYIFPATLDEELPLKSLGPHPKGYYPRMEGRPQR